MTKTASAHLKSLRMAPRKVRFVANVIRKMSARDAEAQLMVQRRRAAVPLLKLLRSAVANAKQASMDADKLVIQSLRIDQGTMLKRFLPKAHGRATPIQKKLSHVHIVLAEKESQKESKFVMPKKSKKSTN